MPVQENVLSWEAVAPNWTSIETGVTHDMGDISATISFDDQEAGDADAFIVDQTVFASADEDADSSLKLYSDFGSDTGGDDAYDPTITATIDFSANTDSELSDNVDNVYFRIDGLDMSADHADAVTITAFDADGNPVDVTLTPTTAQTVTGDTATGTGGTYGAEEELSSLVVSIAGPVSQIVIEYGSAGEGAHQVNVGDIYFDTLDDETDNLIVDGTDDDDVMLVGYVDGDDDTIDGADGDDDTIYGYEGDDEIVAGAGDDTVYGGEGSDDLSGGTGADTLYGGGEDDDIETAGGDQAYGGSGDDVFTVDASDPATDTITIVGGETSENLTDPTNGGDGDVLDLSDQTDDLTVTLTTPEEGLVEGLPADVEFSEIENIELGSGDDEVTGSTGDDVIGLGEGADVIDAGEGDDVVDFGTDPDGTPDGDVDTLVLENGDGDDTLQNFDVPVLDDDDLPTVPNDMLDVTGLEDLGGDPVDTDDVIVTVDVNGDPVINFPGGESVTLTDVDPDIFRDPTTGEPIVPALVAIGIPAPTTGGSGPVDGTAGDDVMPIGYVDADDDTIDGADGDDDVIYGYAGDDIITGGDGADEIYGGDDADTIQLNSDEFDGDDIYGGEGGDDYDTLDTVGTPEDIEVVFDGDESGTVETPNGDIAEFAEIEAVETGVGDDVVDAEDTTDGVDITTNDGSDTVTGGSGDDVIDTSGGNDEAIDTGFDAPSPYDIFDIDPDLDPSDDLDVVYGGAGDDDITTGDDADTIYGGVGDDTIDSGIDDDYVEGGEGDDVINAGQGADEVYGGDGNDTINTGIDTFTDYENDDPTFPFIDPNTTDGSDTVYGGAGEDVITTGDDADTIYGGDDNDTIDAGIDDDDIYGGAGDDSIDGGHGSDLIYGGDGDDTINAAENIGEPELGIGEVLDATDPEPTNGLDTVYGEAGNDTIYGGDDNDVLFGGDDNDVIDGGIDNDELYGGSGEDELSGGQGSDTLDGGTGADTMYGGLDDDDFTVGAGDTAVGDHGDDVFIVDVEDTDGTAITIDGSDGGEGEDPGDTSNDDYEGAPNPTGDVLDLTNLFADGLATAGAVSYTSDDREDGTVTLEDGTIITFEEIENVVVCFTRGTMIETASGMVSVQDLAVGDKVVTKDNGLQELRWIGSRKVAAKGNVAPILIKAGAMANTTDLMVSPQHRMLVEGWKAELLFGEREVLAAAKHLVNNDTIFVQEGGEVEYFHMLFDTHEIVFANGAASESFHPGEVGMGALAEESREEIFALFPELRDNAASFGSAARTSLKGHEAKVLADNPDFLS